MKKPCKALGLVLDIRKVFTKTGKNMMIIQCEGFDYNFEVTVFDRDYEKFNGKIKVRDVIVVDGNVSIDFNFNRKSVQARECKVLSVTQVRDQAKALNMYDGGKRILFTFLESEKEDVKNSPPLKTGQARPVGTPLSTDRGIREGHSPIESTTQGSNFIPPDTGDIGG